MPDEHGRLTPHDLAFGLGRKATKEELEELASRPKGETIDIDTLRKEIKERIESNQNKRKAS